MEFFEHTEHPGKRSLQERMAAAVQQSSSPLVQMCRIAQVRPEVITEGDIYPEVTHAPRCLPKLRSEVLSRLRTLRWDPEAKLDAAAHVWLDPDKMQAWGVVLPPVNGGKPVTAEMLTQALKNAKVRAGLQEEAIAALADPREGCMKLLCVAKGEPAERGANGSAASLISEPQDGKWLVDDWDRVDFAERNWLRTVEAGQKVAEVAPPGPGRDGFDVTGAVLTGRPGRPATWAVGKNTMLSEDGKHILAKVGGSFAENNRRFSVHELLRIPGDVDYQTGNIRFKGTVIIGGNVKPRFRVEADGDVVIYGTVESGYVSAKRDVTVWGGVTAVNAGAIEAGRDLRCKFMENAAAQVGRNAQFEALILSDVSAGGNISVVTGKGSVIGGTLTAMGDIRVRAAGNRAYRATTLALEPTEAFLSRKNKCSYELDTVRAEWQSVESGMRPLIEHRDNPRVAEVLARQAALLIELQERISELKAQLDSLEAMERATRHHRIYTSRAYPNVVVRISGRSLKVNSEYFNATFGIRGKEIRDLNE